MCRFKGVKRFGFEDVIGSEMFREVLKKAKSAVDLMLPQLKMRAVLVDPDELELPPMVDI
jgi:hypothetical protein